MGHLSLALLGTPEIRHTGQPVKFRSRKEQALLIYLAAEGGFHSREKITALLWPESDEPQGRTTLRRTLADLRGRLADTVGQAHLIVERDMLGFDLSTDVEIDLGILESVYASVRGSFAIQQAKGTTARPPLLFDLRRAASLYRGPFLEGFSLGDVPDFDDWVGVQREVWHQRASLILNTLSQIELEAGELLSALETAARWIALDLCRSQPGAV